MKSIRIYLVLVLLSTVCLVIFGAALNGYQNSIEAGEKMLDDRLVSMTTTISRISFESSVFTSNAFADNSIFQIWQDQQLIGRSDNAPMRPLAIMHNGFHTINSEGVRWRVYVHLDETKKQWIIYGEQYDLYRKLIDKLILESILPIIWVLPVLGILIWLIVGKGLQPLRSFAEVLTRRSANELKPIDDDRYPRELSALVASTNTLFARLSKAFIREQRFAADAAHELRTPLAALKLSLHNNAQENPPSRDNFAALEDSAKRMESSIEQILALYRLTPENFQNTLVKCKLRSLIQEVVVGLYPSIQLKEQEIELLGPDIEIEADSFALYLLLKNLIDNAVKYTPNRGSILVSVSNHDDYVVVAVEDSGPGIDMQDYDRVFDRFYRVGQDRHDSGTIGTGLGLSIVKNVVVLHNGSIKLAASDTLKGLSATIKLPKSQPSLGNLSQ